MGRVAAHEVAGLEEHAGLLDGARHAPGIGGGKAQGFLDKHVLLGRGGGQHELLVAVGFRADNDGRDGCVGQDGGHIGRHLCVEFGRPALGACGLVVPDVLDGDILAGLDALDKARRVDMGAADESELSSCHNLFRSSLGDEICK